MTHVRSSRWKLFLMLACFASPLISPLNGEDLDLPNKHTPNLECHATSWVPIKQQHEENMDLLQDPCTDFWQYACGNWRVPNQLRFLKPTDTLTSMKAANKHLLMQHFDESECKDFDTLEIFEGASIQFYQSCLDKRARRSKAQDAQSIRLYTNVLQNFSSSWPILQSDFDPLQAEHNFNWEFVAAQMRRYGTQALVRTLVQPNWQSSQQLVLYVMPPSFELLKARQSDTTIDEESEFLYQRYIKLLMLDLGVKVRKANQIAQEVVDFEKGLMRLVRNEDLLLLKEPQTMASLAADIPNVDLKKFFDSLFQGLQLPHEYEKKMLIVADKSYLKKLVPYLSRAKVQTLANYLMVQFLSHFEVNLNDDESCLKQKEDCLMQVNDLMPSELTQVFLKLQHSDGEAFLQHTQQHLGKIFNNLKFQFEKMINDTTVFQRDVYSKNRSLEKIRNMRLLLPKLEHNSRIALLRQITENYDLNLMALSKAKHLQQFEEVIRHMVSDIAEIQMDPNLSLSSLYLDQSYGPLDVNAYYRLKKNAIELPIGLLRTPLYDRCMKPSQIYGGFVYILGHELLHGFDYDGINYDKSGNANNGWGAKAIIKFGVKSNCYLNERYNNGHMTINENLADSEGLRLALETLLESELGPTFDQDDLKMFFLSFAQTWCGKGPNVTSIRLHSSHQDRVNNVLGNFMEFADIYKCQASTPLHPEEKCRIF